MTDVSACPDERMGSRRGMFQRFLAPLAHALRWAEPFDWDEDEP